MATPDPAALFREMLAQWERVANQVGGEMMKSGEFGAVMGTATSATVRMQEAGREAMGRALAAANMPSRSEVAELTARVAAMDDRLARIEALLTKVAGVESKPPARPKPQRTRKPKSAKSTAG